MSQSDKNQESSQSKSSPTIKIDNSKVTLQVRDQEIIKFNQELEFIKSFDKKFDETVYHYPPLTNTEFQVCDNMIVYQNDKPINHKHFGGIIYHQPGAKVIWYPTRAQIRQQRNGVESQERRLKIGEQAVRAFTSKGDVQLAGYELSTDREVPSYYNVAKGDDMLNFTNDNVTLREQIWFNCSRYEHDRQEAVFDGCRVQELSKLLELDYNLEANIKIDNPKAVLKELRVRKLNLDLNNSESSSKASNNLLPESVSEVSQNSLAQGENYRSTFAPGTQEIADDFMASNYNLQNSLINNGDLIKEIDIFQRDARNAERDFKKQIDDLKIALVDADNRIFNERSKYLALKSSIKKVDKFVSGESEKIERESILEFELSKNTAKTLDFNQKIPVPVKRIKIERIRNMLTDTLMFCTDNEESDDETDSFASKNSQKSEEIEKSTPNHTQKSNPKNTENSTSINPMPQGTKSSPSVFKKIIADLIAQQSDEENENIDDMFDGRTPDFGQLILESEEDDDEDDELHSLLCKRRQS